MTRHIVLIGATGAFGSRLARLLAAIPDIALTFTARSESRATALAHAIRSTTATKCTITPLAFSHGKEASQRLAAMKPFLVIDASGPFQTASYATAQAAIACGAHYIDLADAPAYVLGFHDALDEAARAAKVAALTGASSTPALSFAAVRALSRGWRAIDDVKIAIYPAGHGDVGRAVVEGVLSYAGAEVAVQRAGGVGTVIGWGGRERVHVKELGTRMRSPVATSDYALLPALLGVRNVTFYAGLESRLEHYGLNAIAALRRHDILARPQDLAGVLHRVRALSRRFCGQRGGMTVDIEGIDAGGDAATARWQLIAEDGHGPYVPVLAALAAARRLLCSRDAVPSGARPAAGDLELAAIEAEMAPFAITTHCHRSAGTQARVHTQAGGAQTAAQKVANT